MKIKNIIGSFALSLIFTPAISQVKIDIKERPKPEATFNLKKISINQDALYVLGVKDKSEKSDYYIEKYNTKTLELLFQKDLRICADDKSALVHPGIVPPVCFESNNRLVIFYNSYIENNKGIEIKVKTVDENGEVSPGFITLVSMNDIEFSLDGRYTNWINQPKKKIDYFLSEDKKTIVILVNVPNFRKIFSVEIEDLIKGRSTVKVCDIYDFLKRENLTINKCFSINNKVCFSYIKQVTPERRDFGFAIIDNSGNFRTKNMGLTVSDVFSEDYLINQADNKIMIAGYIRMPIDAERALSIANSKVKQFNVQFDLIESEFKNKTEFEFLPNIAKHLSVPHEAYGFIEKTQTPDHYLERGGLIESPNYYYQISQVVLLLAPYTETEPMQIGYYSYNANGITTVSRDILVTKFEKSGKRLNQYLLPHHTSFNTFIGGKWAYISSIPNRQRNFVYGIKGDDIHFIYLDNLKNSYNSSIEYNPRETVKCVWKNAALIDMSIKKDIIAREVLIEKNNKSIFFSEQHFFYDNSIILDIEKDTGILEIGRVMIN